MITGGCLCGAVRFETEATPRAAFNCYCATCRKESGAGHLTVAVFPTGSVRFIGETKVVAPPRRAGAPPIPRTFCPACGTVLFASPPGMPDYITLRAGTLDDIVALEVVATNYPERAQPWDPPPGGG